MTNRCLTCGTQDWCEHNAGDRRHSAKPCARGCTVKGKHLDDCEGGSWMPYREIPPALWDGDHPHQRDSASFVRVGDQWQILGWVVCRGCQPRWARYGVLCESDHTLLARWLSGQHSLAWVHDWLGANLARGGSSAAKQDQIHPSSGKGGPPLPIREAIHDLRVLLSDRVYIADERVREVFDRPASDTPFTVTTACAFLYAWLTKIEDDPDLVLWLFEKFDEVMRDAGVICPWTDKPRRIVGITCPHCEHESLAVYPGEQDVTCRNCWATIQRERYDIWTRVLAEQARGGAA